ncbi:MAG: sulfatase [Candidatus Coatesbacteria bacterium]|nr:MAG: sulfatase [Candidatus Coatesbacteria bacterium]
MARILNILRAAWPYVAVVIAGGLTAGLLEALSAKVVTLAGCNPPDDFPASALARATFYTAFAAVLGGAVYGLAAGAKAAFARRGRFSPARLGAAAIFAWAAAANIFWFVVAHGRLRELTLFGRERDLLKTKDFFAFAFPALVLGVAAFAVGWYLVFGLTKNRRRVTSYAGVVAVIGWGALAGWTAASRPSPPPHPGYPDVLLVTLDAWRADSWGVNRDGRPLTPALDRFAAEAYVFRNARVQASWTLPSFATILTSQYPAVHGAAPNRRVGTKQATLAEVLAAHGYETYAVLGNDLCLPTTGTTRGFRDYFYWDMNPGLRALGYYETYGYYPPLRKSRKERTDEPITTILTDEVIRRLERGRTKPLFLWVHYLDPHKPYLPPPEYSSVPVLTRGEQWRLPPKKKFRIYRQHYEGEIRYVDAELGRLFAALEGRPNTVVLISSDHGEEFGERFKKNWKKKKKKKHEHRGTGHGHTLYDEQLRVPLIVKFPDRAGGVVEEAVGLIDVAPTILDYVGIEIPPSMQGRSLLDVVDGRAGEEPVFAGPTQLYGGKKEAVVFRGRKLIYIYKKDTYLYFDLEADPDEKFPLPLEAPEAQELKALLQRWREENERLAADYATTGGGADLNAALRAMGYVQ